MKRFNYFVMSLISAAAFTFTACSSSDDLNGGGSGESKVDGFYMTLTVQTPTAGQGTRTSQDARETEPATQDEATINSGSFYLYDGNTLVYKKDITASDWKTDPSKENQTGITKPIKISVNGVEAGKEYKVYFLAGTTNADPIKNPTLEGTYSAATSNLATAGSFVMFNQNDSQRKAGGTLAKVTFKQSNTSADDPAECKGIYLDRIVARIDAPNANITQIADGTDDNAPVTKNLDIVANIQYQGYAISNLSNTAFVMQTWEPEWTTFKIPTDNSYTQDWDTFGNEYNNNGSTTLFNTADKHYVLENTTVDEKEATAVYICYKATVTATEKDFSDGTFYRYDKKIYTSLAQIFADNTAAWPFVNKTDAVNMTPEEALKLIKNDDGTLKDQATLAKFREDYGIDIYEGGMMYYRVALKDEAYHPTTAPYSILRNSIYKLTVNNVYDLGKDVPNGPTPDDKNKNYYMTCTVTVNNWVVSNQSVDLK